MEFKTRWHIMCLTGCLKSYSNVLKKSAYHAERGSHFIESPTTLFQSLCCCLAEVCWWQKNSGLCDKRSIYAHRQEEGFILSTCLDECREYFKGRVLAFCLFCLSLSLRWHTHWPPTGCTPITWCALHTWIARAG